MVPHRLSFMGRQRIETGQETRQTARLTPVHTVLPRVTAKQFFIFCTGSPHYCKIFKVLWVKFKNKFNILKMFKDTHTRCFCPRNV